MTSRRRDTWGSRAHIYTRVQPRSIFHKYQTYVSSSPTYLLFLPNRRGSPARAFPVFSRGTRNANTRTGRSMNHRKDVRREYNAARLAPSLWHAPQYMSLCIMQELFPSGAISGVERELSGRTAKLKRRLSSFLSPRRATPRALYVYCNVSTSWHWEHSVNMTPCRR